MHRRILFVCAGNTCRSPMAAALAASAFPEATIESAGRSPGDAIAQNAIAVMREMIGTDISGARPRGVDEVDLSHFDLVVVLDRSVAEDLALDPRVARLVWDVPDPFGRTLDTYRRCAVDLRDRIEALADLRACSNGGNISWSARR